MSVASAPRSTSPRSRRTGARRSSAASRCWSTRAQPMARGADRRRSHRRTRVRRRSPTRRRGTGLQAAPVGARVHAGARSRPSAARTVEGVYLMPACAALPRAACASARDHGVDARGLLARRARRRGLCARDGGSRDPESRRTCTSMLGVRRAVRPTANSCSGVEAIGASRVGIRARFGGVCVPFCEHHGLVGVGWKDIGSGRASDGGRDALWKHVAARCTSYQGDRRGSAPRPATPRVRARVPGGRFRPLLDPPRRARAHRSRDLWARVPRLRAGRRRRHLALPPRRPPR